MSHVVSNELVIQNLEDLATAAKECGLVLKMNQKKFKWFGAWMRDYHQKDAAYKLGIKPEDYGKCDHALCIPNSPGAYEIGIVKNPKGPGWVLVYDFWDGKLKPLVGEGCEKLNKAYYEASVKRVAQLQRVQFHKKEVLVDGRVKLVVRRHKRKV
jgi:hypothetical protein